MTQVFIGQICLFGFNFAPAGWALCQGQLMAINQNQALFSLIGATYGGNGVSTFALPDLRSRVPLGQGAGPGLSAYVIGEFAGSENASLTVPNLPSHSHTATLQVTSSTRGVAPAVNNFLGTGDTIAPTPPPSLVALNPSGITVQPTGQSVPFPIVQPYLALNFCIALQGIFPSRN